MSESDLGVGMSEIGMALSNSLDAHWRVPSCVGVCFCVSKCASVVVFVYIYEKRPLKETYSS